MEEKLQDKSHWAEELRTWETEGPGPQPRPDSWRKLAAALDEKPPKRRFAWWYVIGIFLVGLALGWLAKSTTVPPSTPTGDLLEFSTEGEQNVGLEKYASTTPAPELAGDTASTLTTQFEQSAALVKIGEEAVVLPKVKDAAAESRATREEGQASQKVTLAGSTVPAISSLQKELDDIAQHEGKVDEPADLSELPAENGLSNENQQMPASDNDSASEEALMTAEPEAFQQNEMVETTRRVTIAPAQLLATDLPLVPLMDRPLAFAKPIRTNRGWSFYAGPTFTFSQPNINITQPDDVVRSRSRVQEAETPWGIALRAGPKGSRWSIQTGYSRGTQNVQHQFLVVRTYDPVRETLSTTEGVSAYSVDIATDHIKATAEVEVVRPTTTLIVPGRQLGIGLNVEERVQTTTIPLLINYDQPLGGGVINLRMGGGLSWNKQQVESVLTAGLFNVNGVTLRNPRFRQQRLLLDESFFVGQLTMGLALEPLPRMETSLQVQWSRSLKNLSLESGTQANYDRTSVQFGIMYRF